MSHTHSEYACAVRRVRRLRKLLRNLALYAAIALGLLLVDLLASPGRFWVQWPVLGLALAAAVQAAGVLLPGEWLGPDWEERRVRELLRDRDR